MKITSNYNMNAKELFNAKNGSVDIKSVLGVQLNAYAAAVAEETNSDGITENIFYIATDSGVIGGKAVAIVEAISDLCDFMGDNEITKENQDEHMAAMREYYLNFDYEDYFNRMD